MQVTTKRSAACRIPEGGVKIDGSGGGGGAVNTGLQVAAQ